MESISVCFSSSANLSLSLDVHIQVLFQLQYFCCSETLRCIDQELNPSQQLRKQPCGGGLTLANCQVPSQLGLSLPLLNRMWGENSMGSLSHRLKFLQDKCAPLRSLLWVSGESLLQHLEHLLPLPASLTLVSADTCFSDFSQSSLAAAVQRFFRFLNTLLQSHHRRDWEAELCPDVGLLEQAVSRTGQPEPLFTEAALPAPGYLHPVHTDHDTAPARDRVLGL